MTFGMAAAACVVWGFLGLLAGIRLGHRWGYDDGQAAREDRLWWAKRAVARRLREHDDDF